MNPEQAGISLLSDDELGTVAGGLCFTRTIVPCPIGYLEIRTPSCSSGPPTVVYIPPY